MDNNKFDPKAWESITDDKSFIRKSGYEDYDDTKVGSNVPNSYMIDKTLDIEKNQEDTHSQARLVDSKEPTPSAISQSASSQSQNSQSLDQSNKANALKKNSSALIIIAVVSAVLICVLLVVIVVLVNNGKNSSSSYEDSSNSNYVVTTEAVMNTEEYDDYSKIDDVNDRIEEVVMSSLANKVSCCIIDVNNSKTFNYGNNSPQTSSALIVIPVLYAYSLEIDQGMLNEDENIPVLVSSVSRGQISKANKGEKRSIESLFNYAFWYSDNNAINSLISYLGYSKIENICREAGYNSITVQKLIGVESKNKNADNKATTADIANMAKELIDTSNFGKRMLDSSNDSVADEHGNIGIASNMNYQYGSVNGYTGKLYNEFVNIDTDGGQFLVVYFSNSDNYLKGTETAKEIGGLLSECLE